MKKKLIVAAMAAMPMMGMFGGNDVSAATVDYIDPPITGGTSTQQESVDVIVNSPSYFTVTIPKTITIDGSKSSSENYTVTVNGDIAGNQLVTVKPTESAGTTNTNPFGITLSEKNGKSGSITAEISQNDISATCQELVDNKGAVGMDGTVTAKNVTAGEWTGTFNFDISLDTK